jgi:hypothetical protein
MEMIQAGIVKPIWPRKVFSFGQINEAFQYMRSGSHIGKIVISDGADRNVQVQVSLFWLLSPLLL